MESKESHRSKLCDVADVAIVDNSADTYCRVNGNNGVVLTVQKQNNYSTADVADKVAAKMKTLTKENKGFHYVNIMDQGVYIDMVTGSVIQNLLMGAILAVFILLLFLKDVRPTIVIACSIPLSVIFCGGVDVLYRNYAKCNLLVGTRTWSGNACGQLRS